MRAVLLMLGLVLAATGCKQVFGLDEPGRPSDAQTGSIPSVGFAGPTTLTDEASGLVMIPVLLSEPVDVDVSVAYSATDITATLDEDYSIEKGRVTIPAGQQTGQLEISILSDIMSEEDETIELRLSDPRQALLALDTNTLTISANVLPRVSFTTPSSSASEASTKVMPMIHLDVASPVPVTVNLNGSGVATSGTDFALTSSQVTIPANQTTALVQVDILNDTLDEDDEDAIVTLVNADTAIVGTAATHVVTIMDNDNAPTASFSTASSSVAENGTSVTLTVNLNAASGKMITVPYTVGGTAAMGMDYSAITASPLTFSPGITAQTITVTLTDDNVDEPNETVVVNLSTPTNATLGTFTTYTLTLTDDEVTCVGPTANAFNVCYDAQPAGPVTLPSSLNTDSSPLCASTQPIGWTTALQPAACVIWATTVTGSSSDVSGSRPLVIAATGAINITGTLDVASHRTSGKTGPGIPSNGCDIALMQPAGGVNGAGGGPGGTFMTKGGNGGKGDAGQNAGGIAATAQSQPTILRGGCVGTRGGPSFGLMAGTPGPGGGAVYIASSTSITLGSNAIINASGAGASSANNDNVGGSGGGSGGMIRLYTPVLSVTGATLMANGGGGGEGNTDVAFGTFGNEANTNSPTQPALGGSGTPNGGNGGSGFAGTTQATDANDGTGTDAAGGGGGGGGGYVQSNLPLTGATVSGVFVMQ